METVGVKRRFFACGYEGGASGQTSVIQGQALIRGRGVGCRILLRFIGAAAPMLSDAAIPCRFAATVLDKMAGRYQHLQMLLHRVTVCAGHIDNLAVGDPSMRFR
jgi:hypothetical protein